MVRQSFADLCRLSGRLLENVAFVRVNENQIDIGTVIEFLSAEFAHPENAKLRLLPAFAGVEVIRLAEPLGELFPADSIHGFQADVGYAGDFACDFCDVAETGEVARGDAEHFTLLKEAQLHEGCCEIARFDQRLQPRVHFAAQTLFLPGVPEQFGVQRLSEPSRMFEQQFVERLRTAKQRGENPRLFRRSFS